MPYTVSKDDRCPDSEPWACKNSETGDIKGCHESKSKAERQRRAIEANTDEEHHSKRIPTIPHGRL